MESETWMAAAITVDKRRPLLLVSEVLVVVLLLVFGFLACSLLWTACTFDEAYLFTVTVKANRTP